MIETHERSQSPPQNWESNVLVPIIQNLAGGLAAAILLAVITDAWNYANSLPASGEQLLRWCVSLGIGITAIATIVRFFGDEIGLMRAIYVAGQRSRDEEIARLNRQISILEQRQQISPVQDATATNAKLGIMAGDRDNAIMLLKILLDGGDIPRNGSHKLTRRPWERAVRLLEKSKVYNSADASLLINSRSEAMRALSDFYNDQYNLARQTPGFTPAWF